MKPKTEILIKYSDLVGKYPLKKIFEYLNILQKTGITNMLGATPYLYGGREWVQKQIDYFDIEEDENVEKLQKNRQYWCYSLIVMNIVTIFSETYAPMC